MATELLPFDMDERPAKRQKTGHTGSGGGSSGFGDGDEEFDSIMAGSTSLGLRALDTHEKRPEWGQLDSADDGSGGGIRVEDLAVANEQGEPIGSYQPPEHMSVEMAHQRFISSSERPVKDFDREFANYLVPLLRQMGFGQQPAGSKADGADGAESESDSSDLALRALDQITKRPGDGRRTQAQKRKRSESDMPQETKRREIERLCEFGCSADREYLLNRFSAEMHHSSINEEHLFSRLCPLCGFMDNTQDAVGTEEFQMIDRFADEGVGNMDPNTHATLLSFLWNKTIYLPMRRRNMRIMPLTSRMALDHINQPHRYNKRAELLRDVKKLKQTHDLLFETSFKRNTMTGELKFDKDRLLAGVKILESKWKILNTKDDPFRTAQRVTAASAGTQTNPLQSVRRRPRNQR